MTIEAPHLTIVVPAYDEQARKLARMFADNFKAFEGDAAPDVKAAGPRGY